jgi:predicted negative regulator of RcsB-dependent stress response
MKLTVRFLYRSLWLVLFLTLSLYSQDKYHFNLQGEWTWEDLESRAKAVAPETVPFVRYLQKEIAIDQARILFRELVRLPSLTNVLKLPELTQYEPERERKLWASRLEKGLTGFNGKDDFLGLISTAVGLTNIRKPLEWGAPVFKSNEYVPSRFSGIEAVNSNIKIAFDFSGAKNLMTYLERESAATEEAVALAKSVPLQAMLKHRGVKRITEEQLLQYLYHAQKRDPLHVLYKWVNPTSFWNFGGVSLHIPRFRHVIGAIQRNEDNIKQRIIARLARYLPEGTTFNATVLFLFSRGADGWATDGNLLGIDLEHYGDDYDYLIRLITHEVFHQGQNEVRLRLPQLLGSDDDRRFVENAMGGVFGEGTATYVGPVRTEIHTSELLEKDFKLFGETFRAIYVERNISEADSLISYGLRAAGPYYTMGAQMAKTIENVFGRGVLVETVQLGPLDFFLRYVEACEQHPNEVPLSYHFPNDIAQKIKTLGKGFPRDMLVDIIAAGKFKRNADSLKDEIDKLFWKYQDSPHKPLLYVLSGQLFLEAGDFSKASDYCRRGLPDAPDRGNTANQLGYAFLHKKAYPEALELFNLYIQFSPTEANAYDSRGEYYLTIGDLERAKEDYEKALQLDPNFENAKKMLKKIETLKH